MDTKDTDGHFHHAILNRINRIIKETGYNPIYFRRLVSEIGGYQAVVQLIEKKIRQAD